MTATGNRAKTSIWTAIHPVFALGQLGVFLVSVVLVGLYLTHHVGFATVQVSVLLKIAFMIGGIVTGALWEHDVFGKWWFATEYFVEDAMTVNVFVLHVAYLVVAYAMPNNPNAALGVLGVAYLAYVINVGQYLYQARAARLREADEIAAAERGIAA